VVRESKALPGSNNGAATKIRESKGGLTICSDGRLGMEGQIV